MEARRVIFSREEDSENDAPKHDWTCILQDAGETPLAPSAMQYLDTTLDEKTVREKYLTAFEKHSEFQEEAPEVDLATMNLIATHLSYSVMDHHLHNFEPEHTFSDKRRYVLLAHLEESTTGRNTVPRLNSMTNSKDPILHEYPIDTDEGLEAQHGVIRFMLQFWAKAEWDLRDKVLSLDAPLAPGWFNDPELLRYVLDHPSQAELIADIMNERTTTDLDLITSLLDSDAVALSRGML